MPRKINQIGPGESPRPSSNTLANDWANVLAQTAAWRKKKIEQAGWERFERYFEGDWLDLQNRISIDVVPLNLVFAYVKTEISKLYFKDPFITVNPRRIEDLVPAKISEAALNATWRDLNLKRECKRTLQDAKIVGHGWIKLGYSAEIGLIESEQAGAKKGSFRNQETVKDVSPNEYIRREHVFAYHYPWKDVLVSPTSKRIGVDSRWIAFKSVVPFRSVIESKIFKNTEGLRPNEPDFGLKTPDLSKLERNVALYEIWDKDFNRVITIAPGHDKVLNEIEWPYDIEGFPCVFFGFNESQGEPNASNIAPYPISDVAEQEPHILELTKMMAIMMNHLKRWNRMLLLPENMLSEEEESKFQRGVDGSIIHYNNTMDPARLFVPPYAPVQQDIYGAWNLLMQIWRNVAGQTEVERGAPARTQTRTLGELQESLKGSSNRSGEQLDSYEDSIREVAKKLLSIMRQKIKFPRLISIVGTHLVEQELAKLQNRPSVNAFPGQTITSPAALTFTGEDLRGLVDVDIVPGSTVPMDRQSKIALYREILSNPQAIGIIPGSQAARELGRELLREVDVRALDRIMDIADAEAVQGSMIPTLQERDLAAKAQADQIKRQGQVAASQAQTRAIQFKAKADIIKSQIKVRDAMVASILERIRSTNGKSEEKES